MISGGPSLVIVGHVGREHVGSHFLDAARAIGLACDLMDSSRAYEAPAWIRRANWWLRGRRPTHLASFGREVLDRCRKAKPDWLLATGIAPLSADTVAKLREAGVRCVNFLTDDPWNRAHSAPWFLEALKEYDMVHTPRHSNLSDLLLHKCRSVEYLPFAYNPRVHYKPEAVDRDAQLESSVVFVGGGDADRLPLVKALIRAGVSVALFGGYWKGDPETRRYSRGFVTPEELRRIVACAGINLCLVRRANRDGHSMRSFEIPACGGAILAEDTEDHRAIFGKAGGSPVFFKAQDELVDAVKSLLLRPDERRQLASEIHDRVVLSSNTYADRLKRILRSPGATSLN